MMRKRHEFDDSVGCEISKTKTPFEFDESLSWEEQAFAEDAAAVWPPRSYFCSFCGRQFGSAQALGGHMNVHRRDRARLKQSLNTTNSSCTLPYDLPNPNTLSPDQSPREVSCCGRSDLKVGRDERLGISCPRVRENDHVGIGILDEGLDFGLCQPRLTTWLSDDGREEGSCKRRKTDDESSMQSGVKSSRLVEEHHHLHHIQSEVIGLSSSSLHDLDLELRLGGLSKG